MSLIWSINSIPTKELSSTLPTKGETYLAPAFAASIACAAENIKVTFTFTKSLDNFLHTFNPAGVQGTLTVAFFPNFLDKRNPYIYISSKSPTTSILISSIPISISCW